MTDISIHQPYILQGAVQAGHQVVAARRQPVGEDAVLIVNMIRAGGGVHAGAHLHPAQVPEGDHPPVEKGIVGAEVYGYSLDLIPAGRVQPLHVRQVNIEHLVEVGRAYGRPGDMVGVKDLIKLLDLLQILCAPLDKKHGGEVALVRGYCALIAGPIPLKFQNLPCVLPQEHSLHRLRVLLVQAVGKGRDSVFHVLRTDRREEFIAGVIAAARRKADIDGKFAPLGADL